MRVSLSRKKNDDDDALPKSVDELGCPISSVFSFSSSLVNKVSYSYTHFDHDHGMQIDK